MPPSPRDLERDLRIVEATVSDLKDYLLSDQVYWSLSSRGSMQNPFPKGTLGGLLFRRALLDALRGQLAPRQWERFAEARAESEETLHHWSIQAEQKAGREVAARTRTWASFVEEAAGDPQRHNAEYGSQAEGRTVIAFLQQFAAGAVEPITQSQLAAADRDLERISHRGDFVWHASLKPVFPEDMFGWLYVTLR